VSEGPLTYDDLASHWGVCQRQAKRIARRLGLKPMRLGHRTVRFRPADVVSADERATKINHKDAGRRAA